MRLRRLVLALPVAVAALALAACGGGSSSGSDEGSGNGSEGTAVLASAASNVTDAGSSKVDFTVTTQVPGQEGPVTLTGTGQFDYVNRTGSLTYDFSELLGALGQDAGGTTAEVIVDGTVVYMKFPLFSALLPGAKEWIKIDAQAAAEGGGVDLSQIEQINQGDPSQVLDYLRATGDVEEVGTEEIRGVQTTHYRALVQLDDVAAQAPEGTREQVQAQIDQLKEQTGLTEFPVDVWVDAEGLPVRIGYEYDISLPGSEEQSKTILTMDFYDYGVAVDVEPPPADQVTDLAELAQLGSTS